MTAEPEVRTYRKAYSLWYGTFMYRERWRTNLLGALDDEWDGWRTYVSICDRIVCQYGLLCTSLWRRQDQAVVGSHSFLRYLIANRVTNWETKPNNTNSSPWTATKAMVWSVWRFERGAIMKCQMAEIFLRAVVSLNLKSAAVLKSCKPRVNQRHQSHQLLKKRTNS